MLSTRRRRDVNWSKIDQRLKRILLLLSIENRPFARAFSINREVSLFHFAFFIHISLKGHPNRW